MALDITEFPRGLQAILGLRDGGLGTRNLSETVAPTIDTGDLFLFGRRENVFQSGVALNLAAGGQTIFSSAVVPPGEAWFVWNYQFSVATAVGETARVLPSVRIGGAGIVTGPSVALAASEFRYQIPYAGRVWLAPGDALVLSTEAGTGAPTAALSAAFTRVRV